MTPHAAESKTRAYSSPGRSAQAAATRRRIVTAAREHLLRDGFVAAAMSAIAADAGVSLPSVYKVFGNKAQLAKAVVEDALAGEGAVSAPERAAEVSRSEPDPRRRLRAFGRFVAEVAPRVAPLLIMIKAAASAAPELLPVQQELDDERLASMTRHARQLAADGHLRPGLSVGRAADILWTYTAPDVFELLVIQRGWSTGYFAQWVAEAYIAALLEPTDGAGRSSSVGSGS